MIKQLLSNWKTTASGLTLMGGAIIHLVFAIKAKIATEETWTIAFGMVVGGIGLMFAGDSNVSAAASTKNAVEIDRINALGSNPNSKQLAPNVPVVPNPVSAEKAQTP